MPPGKLRVDVVPIFIEIENGPWTAARLYKSKRGASVDLCPGCPGQQMLGLSAVLLETKAAGRRAGWSGVQAPPIAGDSWPGNESARLRGHSHVSWLPDLGSNQGPTD